MFQVGEQGPLRNAAGLYEILALTQLWGCDVIVAKVTYPSGNETLQTRFLDGRINSNYISDYDFMENANECVEAKTAS